ncbi:MAG: hypothetical protein D3909_10920, partial [Candidatus Electrothrix sp. ATG1]|nr:hypothetical protein [Candidatus Electrothrix sp. ATG1]
MYSAWDNIPRLVPRVTTLGFCIQPFQGLVLLPDILFYTPKGFYVFSLGYHPKHLSHAQGDDSGLLYSTLSGFGVTPRRTLLYPEGVLCIQLGIPSQGLVPRVMTLGFCIEPFQGLVLL